MPNLKEEVVVMVKEPEYTSQKNPRLRRTIVGLLLLLLVIVGIIGLFLIYPDDVSPQPDPKYPSQISLFSVSFKDDDIRYTIYVDTTTDSTLIQATESPLLFADELLPAQGYLLQNDQLLSLGSVCQREDSSKVGLLPVTAQKLKVAVEKDRLVGRRIYGKQSTCSMYENQMGMFVCLDAGLTILMCEEEENPDSCLIFSDHNEDIQETEVFSVDHQCPGNPSSCFSYGL
ncbi:hypothetical protein GEMRC1_000494 [Eukaryota sp. GEM-RC1]